jgi:hypothetical protein
MVQGDVTTVSCRETMIALPPGRGTKLPTAFQSMGSAWGRHCPSSGGLTFAGLPLLGVSSG